MLPYRRHLHVDFTLYCRFRIIIPLNENYSYDYGSNDKTVSATLAIKDATLDCDFETKKHKNATLNSDFGTKDELNIIQLIKENPSITQSELQKKTGISLGTIKIAL